MATPSPDTPAHRAMARARSDGSVKTLVRIDSVAGMMNAAPKPWMARVAMRVVGSDTIEQASDPRPKTTRPNRNVHLRPRRSPVLPAMSRKLANTIV